MVRPDNVVQGIEKASSERVKEGNTGGGTGMMCQGHKGGTGSASRVVESLVVKNGVTESKKFTLGVLVQANYGNLATLKIGGVPIGRIIQKENGGVRLMEKGYLERIKLEASEKKVKDGSIIIIVATDAPLHPMYVYPLSISNGLGKSWTNMEVVNYKD